MIALFRIADRYDVKRVIADCEYHLYGVNGVPWFDKLKLVVDLHRDQLKVGFSVDQRCNTSLPHFKVGLMRLTSRNISFRR